MERHEPSPNHTRTANACVENELKTRISYWLSPNHTRTANVCVENELKARIRYFS